MQYRFLMLISMVLVFWSCDEKGTSVFSLDQEEFSSALDGSMEVLVDRLGAPMELTGNLNLIDGECLLQLYSPIVDTVFVNDTTWIIDQAQLPDSMYRIESVFISDTLYYSQLVYEEIYVAPAEVKISEQFERILGDWFFVYKIVGVDDEEPFGSFDFTIRYQD